MCDIVGEIGEEETGEVVVRRRLTSGSSDAAAVLLMDAWWLERVLCNAGVLDLLKGCGERQHDIFYVHEMVLSSSEKSPCQRT